MNEITMKTTKGNTTINLRYVSAYTVNEVSEADYLIFKNKWSEKQ